MCIRDSYDPTLPNAKGKCYSCGPMPFYYGYRGCLPFYLPDDDGSFTRHREAVTASEKFIYRCSGESCNQLCANRNPRDKREGSSHWHCCSISYCYYIKLFIN